ncbi:MDR family MFS transporter [Amycolatopsis sp. NPDC004378]
MTASETTAGQTRRSRTGWAVAALAAVLLLVALDQTVVGTAMPQVISELHGFELYGWVTTAYLLAEMVAIPVFGKLGDRFGRSRLTMAGVGIFLAGSWAGGLSGGMTSLILFRGVQGLGGGIVLATLFALIADIYPDPARRARAQGVFGGMFSLASVVGPWIGGLITDHFSWRWVFYVNLPVGAVALVLLPIGLAGIAAGTPAEDRKPIDWAGAVTISGLAVGVLLGLTWVGDGDGWTSARVLCAFGAAAVFFAAFVVAERRAADPILPGALFLDRTVAGILLAVTALGFAMFGAIIYTPLFVQGVLGSTATGSGTVLLPLVLTMTASGILAGSLLAKWGRVRPFILAGAGLTVGGTTLLATLDAHSSQLTAGCFLVFLGVGMGLLMTAGTTGVQAAVSPDLLGSASSATQFLRTLGSTIGTAVLASAVARGYSSAYRPAGSTPRELAATLADPDVVSNADALGRITASGYPRETVDVAIGAAREALASGLRGAFVIAAAVAVLAVGGAVLMRDLELDPAAAGSRPDKH